MAAYRRRQQVGKPDAFNYDSAPPPPPADSSASSLAAKAIRASSAYRESSLSSVYEQSALSSPSSVKDRSIYENPPTKTTNESKRGFWGALARKAKSFIDEDDDDDTTQPHETRENRGQYRSTYDSSDSHRKTEGPAIQKGLDAITSSLNYIGKSLEEGITAVENRTAGLIQETRKIQIRKKNDSSRFRQPPLQSQNHTTLETQLKASRDVAMAMAAKAKLLMRELKTVKADLAFAKDRCGQLEEENRILRQSREKGDNPDDDDLIRLQLESLLAEKARLAQENSLYARENRFLREIVEFHQLTMQDVVYFDEGSEEVSEVYPLKISTPSAANPTPTVPHGAMLQAPHDLFSNSLQSREKTIGPANPYVRNE